MSNFGDLYDQPPINLVDGVARDRTILDLGYQIESTFEVIGDLFGNLHGLGYNTLNRSLYFNSLAASLGDMSKISPEEPFGVIFENYSETFTTSDKKDYVLDLIPTSDTTGDIIINAPDFTWTYRQALDDLNQEGDFTIVGRVLTFYIPPASGFSITYNGKYPDISNKNSGFTPNVYPSPHLIDRDLIDKPQLIILPSGRYKVVVEPYALNSDEKQFGAPLKLNYGSLLESYVDSSGITECPVELASIWVKGETGTYSKVDARSIYLISDKEFQFEADIVLHPDTDIAVIALANSTLADVLKDVYNLLRHHTHDKTSISTPMGHDRLINLVPASEKADIVYAGSEIPSNDHPQYLHREGYRASDPGTYDNALLGDLLIASTDSSSLFNNVDSDSNRLIFGSTSSGVSFNFRESDKDLLVYSPENGISIESNIDDGKASFALRLNSHQFFNYRESGDHLTISSVSEKVRIGLVDDDVNLGDLELRDVTVRNRAIFEDLSGITMGEIDIYNDNNTGYEMYATSASPETHKIYIENRTELENAQANMLNIIDGTIESTVTLADMAEIQVYNSDTYLSNMPGTEQALFVSPISLRFGATGYSTGVSFGTDTEEYFNLYASASNAGPSTPSDTDVYAETYDADFYFLKTTKKDHIEDSQLRKWKDGSPQERVDDLQDWPRSSLHAGSSTLRDLTVNTSSVIERKGVSFGNFNHIFVTGSGTTCPAGWMVLESQNGVVLANSSSANMLDCETISYAELTSGDISAFGSIIAQGDISSGENITSNKKITGTELNIIEDTLLEGDTRLLGKLIVEEDVDILGESKFRSNVEIIGELNVKNELITEAITANGIVRLNEPVTIDSTLNVNDLAIFGENVTVTGRLNVSDSILTNGLIAGTTSLGATTVNDTLTTKSPIDARSDVNVEGSLSVNGLLSTNNSVNIAETLTAENILTISDLEAGEDFVVKGNSTFRGDATFINPASQLLVQSKSLFSGQSTFNEAVEIYGTVVMGNSLEVNSQIFGKSSLEIEGVATFKSSVNVEGAAYIQDFEVSGTGTVSGNLNIEGFITGNTMLLEESLIVNGDMTGGLVVAKTGFQASPGTQSTFYNATINGSLLQSSSTVTVEFAGRTEFNNTVKINSTLNVTNSIEVGTRAEAKITLGENSITVGALGNRGSIIAGEMRVSKVIGASEGVYLPDEIFGVINIGNNLSTQKFVNIDNLYVDKNAVFTGAIFCNRYSLCR